MSAQRKIRVAVVFGGKGPEHAVSCMGGGNVLGAIDRDRYEVIPVGITREGNWVLTADEPDRLAISGGELPSVEAVAGPGGQVVPWADQSVRALAASAPGQIPQLLGEVDVVLPVLHGPFGEDGTVQGMLEMVGLPYVGSGVMGAALTMDKDLVKRVLRDVGIATAPSVTFRSKTEHDHEAELAAAGIAPPCFVKPARLGSSVGISKVRTIDELPAALELAFRHDWKVLVEQMVVGREVECGVLGNDDPIVSVPGELTVNADWYDFDAKYLPGGMDLTVPAELDLVTTEELQRTSKLAFQVCECAGMARIDFFVTEDGAVVLNEINAIPGFTSTSVYSRLFEASGIGYGELLDRLIALALERHREARGYQY